MRILKVLKYVYNTHNELSLIFLCVLKENIESLVKHTYTYTRTQNDKGQQLSNCLPQLSCHFNNLMNHMAIGRSSLPDEWHQAMDGCQWADVKWLSMYYKQSNNSVLQQYTVMSRVGDIPETIIICLMQSSRNFSDNTVTSATDEQLNNDILLSLYLYVAV